jgi:hypothetical protein
MKTFPVRHAKSQHIKVEDIMSDVGCDKSTVVRAAMWYGLQEICKSIQKDKDKAIEKLAIANLKAR